MQNAKIPKIRLFKSEGKLLAQIWTQFGADSVNEVVSRAAALSPFLNGEGKKTFRGDYLTGYSKPENFLKILEGNLMLGNTETPIRGRIKSLGEK